MTPDERHALRLKALKVLGIPIAHSLNNPEPVGVESCEDIGDGELVLQRGDVCELFRPELDIAQAIRVAKVIAGGHVDGIKLVYCRGRAEGEWLADVLMGRGWVMNDEPAEALLRAALAAGEKT